ncbi:MAG: LTA synthase family protein [Bacillota bacterium]
MDEIGSADSTNEFEDAGTPAVPESRGAFGSTFWLTLWMALALVGCKVIHAQLPGGWSWPWLKWYGQNLLIVSHADVLYAIVVGLIGQGALLAVRRWRWVQMAVWFLIAFYCAVSVLYGVISVQIFWFLRMPLTYPLIYLSGDMKNMQSSVGAFLTPRLATALIGLPVTYIVLVWLTARIQLPQTRRARGVMALAMAGILAGAFFAHREAVGAWRTQHDDRRIAESPHYVLLASCVTETLGGQGVYFKESFPAEDQKDFLVVDERPGGAPPTPMLRRGPRNVIVYVLESVATQQLSLYGSPFKTTPRLEAEVGNCLIFDNFYAHFTNSANAVVSILLSTYPPLTWREYTVERPDLPGVTVANIVKPLGYRTAWISAGDNQFSNVRGFLQHRGFDDILDYRDASGPKVFSWGVEDRCHVDDLLHWIDRDRGKPFFLVSWNTGTHNPYYVPTDKPAIDFLKDNAPPITGAGGFQLDRYLNAVHEADAQIGRLLDGLRQRNLADDTVVVLVGDHGEDFGYPHNSWGHSGKVYQEDVNVPFILWNPVLFKGAARSKVLGAHLDLSPTVLDLLNIPCPPKWQGRSMFDPSRPPRAYFYGAMEDLLIGMREQNYKYIFNATMGMEELYDLAADPQEQTNTAAQHRELARRLRQRLGAWVDYQKRYVGMMNGSNAGSSSN